MWQYKESIKRKMSHILVTAPTYATDYDKKRFSLKNLDTNKTSDIGQNLKKHTNTT